jgi:hypothetical protein
VISEAISWFRGWFWANAQTIAAVIAILLFIAGVIYESLRTSARLIGFGSQPIDPANEPKGRPAERDKAFVVQTIDDTKRVSGYRFVAGQADECWIRFGPGYNLIALRKLNGVERTAELISLSSAKPGTYGFSKRKDVTKAEGFPFSLDYLWPEATTDHDSEVHKAIDGKTYLAGYCDPKELANILKRKSKAPNAFSLFCHHFKAARQPVAVDIDLIYATNWYKFASEDEKGYPTFLKIWLLD